MQSRVLLAAPWVLVLVGGMLPVFAEEGWPLGTLAAWCDYAGNYRLDLSYAMFVLLHLRAVAHAMRGRGCPPRGCESRHRRSGCMIVYE